MANKIRLLITDCDGCLTPGTVTYTVHRGAPHVSRQFSVIDGMGFQLLNEAGIEVVILSSSSDDGILYRAQHLGVECKIYEKNKADWLTRRDGFSPDETAYFGDDVNDLAAMKLCLLPLCPNSAQPEVLDYCEENGIVVSGTPGINAFRNVSRLILTYNKHAS